MSRVAMCHRCPDEPLVMTFAWPRKEFLCLGCGALYEFLAPRPEVETADLVARAEERKAEWQALSDGLIPATAFRTDCRDAGGPCDREYHRAHASPEELAAHEEAARRIGERLGRAAP